MAFTLFLYHSVDDSGSFLSVSPAQFRAQMRAVFRSGRRVLTVAEASRAATNGEDLSNAVCITFDDAYQSVADHAWPILHDLHMPATVYCVSGLMGGKPDWLERLFPGIFSSDPAIARSAFERDIGSAGLRDRSIAADPVLAFQRSADLRIMSWDTARDLVAEGMDPGGHTASHPYLTRLTGDGMRREIAHDRDMLQDQLHHEVATFAYPFGDENAAVRQAVKDAGYSAAVTSAPGAIHDPQSDPFGWARIGVWPRISGWRMRLYLSSLYARARAS